jgi:hypothetical protein
VEGAYTKKPIEVPTVVFAGLDDPILDPEVYRRGARMFSAGYTVEEMPGRSRERCSCIAWHGACDRPTREP